MSPVKARPGLWKTISVVSAVAFLATAGSLWLAYATACRQVLGELASITGTAADLIESAARMQPPSADSRLPEDAREATLRRLGQGLASDRDPQGTAELLVVFRSARGWRVLRATAGQGFQLVAELADGNERAQLMREALGGKRGSGKFTDYRGEPVLAAFAPVPSLDLAVVHTLNRGDAAAPFRRAVAWAVLVYLLMVGALVVGYRRLSRWMDGSIHISQRQLDTVFETAPVVMVLLSPEGLIERVNPCFEQITGWKNSELRGRDWFDTCLPPRDSDRIRVLFQSDLRGESTLAHINSVLTRSGAEHEIEWNSNTLRDAAGLVSAVLAVGIDVTERQRAAENLRRSEEDFRALFERAALGMMSGTPDGSIRRVNQRMSEILGYTPEEICNLGPAAISHPDDLALDRDLFAKLAAREITHYSVEKRYLRKDGRVIWGQLTLSNRIEDGQIVEMLGVLQDITDRKVAEEQLRLSQEIISAVTEGVLIARVSDGQIISANHQLEVMLGRAPGSLVGQHVGVVNDSIELGVVEENADAEEWTRELPRAGEFLVRRENGDFVWCEATVAALPKARPGQDELYVSVYRDISKRKQAEDALRESEDRLRLSLAAAGQGFYDLDLTTGEAHVSPEYAAMIGEDPATFHETNAKWSGRLHPDDRSNVYATFEAYVRGEIAHYEVEFRQRTSSGGWLWTLSIGSIVTRDPNGVPVRLLGTHTNIDARKRAAQALAKRDAQLRAIVSASSDGIIMADVETRQFVFASPAMCRMLGYSQEELLNLGVVDIHPPESMPMVERQFIKMALGKLTGAIEVPMRRKDGSKFIAEVTGAVLEFSGRRYNSGVFRDISERRAQEESLRIKEAAIENAANGIAIATPAGVLTYANRAYLALLGLTEGSDVIGRSVLEPWRDQAVVSQAHAALQAEGIWSGELAPNCADGVSRLLDVQTQKLMGAEGKTIALTASFVDVTRQRAMEEALRRSEAMLKAAQRIARLGSWELHLESGRLYWTDETFRLFEVDATSVEPSYQTFLQRVHVDDRAAVDAAYSGSLRDRQPYRIVHRLQMGDGRIKYVEEQCETEFDANGRPLVSRGTTQDVTERVLAEQITHRSLAEKETLLREIHHRVKNNLQIVSSLLYFEGRKVEDQQALEVFGVIRDRLRAMVLVHERLYSSGDLSAVDFADYVRSLADQLLHSTACASRSFQLRVDTAEMTLPIETALPCGMILTELLTNINKYAFPDDRPGEAMVQLTAAYGRVQLIVRDNGVGMPPEFDADFPQSFGWQLVHNLSEQIGGALVLDRNNGVSVTLSFPLSKRALPVEVSG